VEHFNRLTGYKLLKNRTPIEMAIDEATEYNQDKEAIPAFMAFVYEFFWDTFFDEAFKDEIS
jgi:hypothetical protein